MDNVIGLFAGISQLLKMKFGLQFEQAVGDISIKVVTTMLQDMSLSPFEKAKRDYYVGQVQALYTALTPLMVIAQPSSQQQADIKVLQGKVKEIEQQLSSM